MSFFGKNIKKIRIAKKLSQTAFAELFGLKRTALGAYELNGTSQGLRVFTETGIYGDEGTIEVWLNIDVNDILQYVYYEIASTTGPSMVGIYIGDDGKKRYVKKEFTGRRFEKWATAKKRARENRKKYEKYNGGRPLFPND